MVDINIENNLIYGTAIGLTIGFFLFTQHGRGAVTHIGSKASKGLARL